MKIISDQGCEFDAKLTTEFGKMMGVNLKCTTSFNPRANEVVERPWRTLKDMFKAYVNTRQDNWDTFLPLLQLAFNTAQSSTTNFTPYFLMFARQAILPLEVHWNIASRPTMTRSKYIKSLQQELLAIFELVREHVSSSRKKSQLD